MLIATYKNKKGRIQTVRPLFNNQALFPNNLALSINNPALFTIVRDTSLYKKGGQPVLSTFNESTQGFSSHIFGSSQIPF